MNKVVFVILSSLVIASCNGGGGGGSSSKSPNKASLSYILKLKESNIFSNSGNITIEASEIENISNLEIYEDVLCQNLSQTLNLSDLRSGLNLSLQTLTENTMDYFAKITTTYSKVECVKLFSYTYDITPPGDPTELDTGLLSINGTVSSDNLFLKGDPSVLGNTLESDYIIFYDDSSKTNELGRISLEEYRNGYNFTPPSSHQNQNINLYVALGDKAGNESQTYPTPINFTHDNLPPTQPALSLSTSGLDNTYSSITTDYDIDFDVDDLDTNKVLIYIGDSLVSEITTIPIGGNIVQSISIPENQLSEISIYLEDSLGNRTNKNSYKYWP